MEKTFQYHQQIFVGLELEIYNDLLKNDKIFLQCAIGQKKASSHSLDIIFLGRERSAQVRPISSVIEQY